MARTVKPRVAMMWVGRATRAILLLPLHMACHCSQHALPVRLASQRDAVNRICWILTSVEDTNGHSTLVS